MRAPVPGALLRMGMNLVAEVLYRRTVARQSAPDPAILYQATLNVLRAAPPAQPIPDNGIPSGEALETFTRPESVPEGYVHEEGVVFGTGGGRALTLELYRPAAPTGPSPGVVFVHGGGFVGGFPEMHVRHAHALAGEGYVTATINYRLAQEAPFPACVEDAKCAVRWMRANAGRLGVDPNRIAVAGGSAGGYLAAMVALTPGQFEGTGGNGGVSSWPQVAILWYPLTDVAWPGLGLTGRFASRALLGGRASRSLRALASPVSHVRRDAPPILTMTGGADPLTVLPMIQEFHRRLDAAGAVNQLEVHPAGMHAFDFATEPWRQCYASMSAFLERHLGAARAVSAQVPTPTAGPAQYQPH